MPWAKTASRESLEVGLELGDCISVRFCLQVEIDQLQIRLRHLGIELQSALQALFGQFRTVGARIQHALQEVAEGGIGHPLQSFINFVFGVGIALRQQQHVGEIEVGFDVVLIRLERGFKLLIEPPRNSAGPDRQSRDYCAPDSNSANS